LCEDNAFQRIACTACKQQLQACFAYLAG